MSEEENLMLKTQSLLREVVSNLESSPHGAQSCESQVRDREASHAGPVMSTASVEFRLSIRVKSCCFWCCASSADNFQIDLEVRQVHFKFGNALNINMKHMHYHDLLSKFMFS